MTDGQGLEVGSLDGIRILAAEDVEVNRLVLEDLLVREGAEVVLVDDGQQALSLIELSEPEAFHLILMDVQMPVMDGLEATRRILAIFPEIPIIGLTAHELVAEQQRCLEAGMVDHVTKPVESETLVNVISRYVVSSADADQAEAEFVFDDAAQDSPHDRPIDWVALAARYQGREHFIDRLVESALRSHDKVPASLRQLADEGDVVRIGELAHSIKSLAGNLEARSTEQLAMQVETCVIVGNDSTCYVALELANSMELLLTELRTRAGA